MKEKWWKDEHPCGRCGGRENAKVGVAAEEGYVQVCEVCLTPGERLLIDEARQQSQDDHRGIYEKYRVHRIDGRDRPGQRHDGCRYFVLDIDHDPYAGAALEAYARACEASKPQLSRDLVALVQGGDVHVGKAAV